MFLLGVIVMKRSIIDYQICKRLVVTEQGNCVLPSGKEDRFEVTRRGFAGMRRKLIPHR